MALDSHNALVNSARNVFWKNEVAARVDIEDAQALGINDWTGNVFLENGTAVQIPQPAPQPEPLLFPGFRRAILSVMERISKWRLPGTSTFTEITLGKGQAGPGERQGFLSQLDGAHTEKELKNLVKYKPPKVECRHSSTKSCHQSPVERPLQYQLSSLLPETAQRTCLQAADSPRRAL